jgi:para-nitrobenzyl esterase
MIARLVAVLALLAGPALAQPTARIETGALRGVVREGVEQFLGVPYAAPPVGALRWAAPQAPIAWKGERDENIANARCPQTATADTPRSEDEDCLILNVYRPVTPSKRPRAVFLYVHGGGATNGAGIDHDGAALAGRGDIVVVTINYRLGALGFLNHPTLGHGNYALQDVEAALRWTARNIGAFGGDPAKVTIGGESAGGTVLCPLLTSKSAKGLFRAAIISSDDCLHDVDLPAASLARGEGVLSRAGCADAACLRALPAGRVVDIGGFSAPVVEAAAFDQIARGQWNPVPVLLGANREEGRLAGPAYLGFDKAAYTAWLRKLVPDAFARRIEQAYPVDKPGLQAAYTISAVITDSGMRGFGGCTSLALAQAMAAKAPVYYYQFEDPNPPFDVRADGYRFAAAHSAELSYLWPGGVFVHRVARLSPDQRRLSDRMIAYWTAFVRDGDPGGGWPRMQPKGGKLLALKPGATDAVKSSQAFAGEHRCALWSDHPWIMARG